MKKQVDIVIPVHNRLEHTKQTFESLFANTSPDLYTLYVIDDGSDPETKTYLEQLSKQGKLDYLHRNSKAIGPAASRNFVCHVITKNDQRGTFLYHSDNDVYFKKGWLEDLLRMYVVATLNNIKLLGGGCHPYLQSSTRVASTNVPYQIGIKDAVSGYSQLMEWETWDKYGPFDEGQGGQEVKTMGSEDWALCQRIIKDGFAVGSIEPEVVIHTGKTNTYGQQATGAETFKDIAGITIK